jgi:hypothetical protein
MRAGGVIDIAAGREDFSRFFSGDEIAEIALRIFASDERPSSRALHSGSTKR